MEKAGNENILQFCIFLPIHGQYVPREHIPKYSMANKIKSKPVGVCVYIYIHIYINHAMNSRVKNK